MKIVKKGALTIKKERERKNIFDRYFQLLKKLWKKNGGPKHLVLNISGSSPHLLIHMEGKENGEAMWLFI